MTNEVLKQAESIGVQMDYAKSLLNTFIDQWRDLQRAAAADKEESSQWHLNQEFNRVSGRIETLLNLNDELLTTIGEKGEDIVDVLLKVKQTES